MQIHSTLSLAVAALLVSAAPAHAGEARNESSPAQVQGKSTAATASAAGEKKVCKKLVTSGTRFTEKVCLTKQEWKRVEAQG